jgi:hypothetical protein
MIRRWLQNYPHYAVALLIVLTILGYFSSIYFFAYEARKQVAYDKARSFLESIIGMHQYYSKEIVPRIKSSGADLKMHFKEDPSSFPFPAAVSIEFGRALKHVNK